MHKPATCLLFLLALFSSPIAKGADFVPGEVLVKYKESVVRNRAQVNSFYDSMGVRSVNRFSDQQAGFEQLFLDEEDHVQDVVERLRKNDSVEYAQPNYILHILPVLSQKFQEVQETEEEECSPAGSLSFFSSCKLLGLVRGGRGKPRAAIRPEIQSLASEDIPYQADPKLSRLYGITKVGALAAWLTNKGSKSVIVANIDTGIDYNHEDLAFNMWRNPNPSKGDLVGYDFVHKDGLPYDDNEHGTHTAGTIGAVGGNGVGISGVNQRVSLMALKFLSGEGDGTTADAIRAIDYAVSHGAKVLNNSWGGPGDKTGADNLMLREAFERAKKKDVLFITAAGNEGNDNDGPGADFPAGFAMDNQISVAATDADDELASFSNYGKRTTHLAAPGVDIYSTVPGGKYKVLSGSSMACPHVAGAAALLWSAHPNWNYKQIKAALLNSVDRLPGLVSKLITGGRLNINQALQYQ
ncbi:MAG: S8 family peptidase [Bdellovibrionia bacterium]